MADDAKNKPVETKEQTETRLLMEQAVEGLLAKRRELSISEKKTKIVPEGLDAINNELKEYQALAKDAGITLQVKGVDLTKAIEAQDKEIDQTVKLDAIKAKAAATQQRLAAAPAAPAAPVALPTDVPESAKALMQSLDKYAPGGRGATYKYDNTNGHYKDGKITSLDINSISYEKAAELRKEFKLTGNIEADAAQIKQIADATKPGMMTLKDAELLAAKIETKHLLVAAFGPAPRVTEINGLGSGYNNYRAGGQDAILLPAAATSVELTASIDGGKMGTTVTAKDVSGNVIGNATFDATPETIRAALDRGIKLNPDGTDRIKIPEISAQLDPLHDKRDAARKIVIAMGMADRVEGLSQADIERDPVKLAKALDMDGKNGLTLGDLRTYYAQDIKGNVRTPEQLETVVQSMAASLNKAGIYVGDENAPEKPSFDLRRFHKIADKQEQFNEFEAFARSGGLNNLNQHAMRSIHPQYFERLHNQGIKHGLGEEKYETLLTKEQQHAYTLGSTMGVRVDYQLTDNMGGYIDYARDRHYGNYPNERTTLPPISQSTKPLAIEPVVQTAPSQPVQPTVIPAPSSAAPSQPAVPNTPAAQPVPAKPLNYGDEVRQAITDTANMKKEYLDILDREAKAAGKTPDRTKTEKALGDVIDSRMYPGDPYGAPFNERSAMHSILSEHKGGDKTVAGELAVVVAAEQKKSPAQVPEAEYTKARNEYIALATAHATKNKLGFHPELAGKAFDAYIEKENKAAEGQAWRDGNPKYSKPEFKKYAEELLEDARKGEFAKNTLGRSITPSQPTPSQTVPVDPNLQKLNPIRDANQLEANAKEARDVLRDHTGGAINAASIAKLNPDMIRKLDVNRDGVLNEADYKEIYAKSSEAVRNTGVKALDDVVKAAAVLQKMNVTNAPLQQPTSEGVPLAKGPNQRQ